MSTACIIKLTMIVSRALPTLIRLNHVIKLCNVKTKFSHHSKHSLKILYPGKINYSLCRNMSVDVEKELKDPKRHFDYQQLIQKKDKEQAVVIDVREHSEINETGKIPGSIHIPLNELKNALGEMIKEEFGRFYKFPKPEYHDEIIFTCRSGRRSLTAMKIAYELGYKKAGNYKGGWLDWAEKSKSQ